MKPALVVALLLTTAVSARADEVDAPPAPAPAVTDRGYAALGWEALADSADSGGGATFGEGAVRIQDSGVLLHGLAGRGSYTTDEGTGPLTALRLGIEADTCSEGRLLCGFVGADAGHRWASWRSKTDGMTTDVSRDVVAGRAGFDAGNQLLRVRVAIEYTGDAIGMQLALVHRFYAR